MIDSSEEEDSIVLRPASKNMKSIRHYEKKR